ncbi:MAG: hypothetical protein Fur0039_14860 [Rhodocyclaceae bacterium]
MGRTRNLATSPEGKRLWPVLENKRILEAIPHLREYPFEQTAIDAITARLVCVPARTPERLRRLQATLAQMPGRADRWTWRLRDMPLSAGGRFAQFIGSIHDTRKKA